MRKAIEDGLHINKLNIERSASALTKIEATDPGWDEWMTILKEGIEGAESDRQKLLDLSKN